MRGMAANHGSAPRLGEVADEQAGPAVGAGGDGEALDEGDQRWVTPGAVARQPDRLPPGPFGGQREAPPARQPLA